MVENKNRPIPPRGIGIDIIEIERIKEGLARHGKPFLAKILTPKEQEYCFQQKDPHPRIAGRFAAKEAIVKALGTGFGQEIGFLDIEILPDLSGCPIVSLTKTPLEEPIFLLSISHCVNYATAVAICY